MTPIERLPRPARAAFRSARTLLPLAFAASSAGCLALVDADFENAHLSTSSCQPQSPAIECGIDAVDEDCDGRTGAVEWSFALHGGSLERVTAARATPDGGLVMTGYHEADVQAGDVTLPPGAFVVKVDASGHVAWARRFGEAGAAFGNSLAVEPNGDAIVLVDASGTFDYGGGPVEIPETGDHSVIVRLRGEDGSHVWSRLVGDASAKDIWPGAVAVDAEGNILLGSQFSGALVWPEGEPLGPTAEPHFFLSRLDPDGHHIASYDLGGGVSPRRVAVADNGDLIALGVILAKVDLGGGPLGDGSPTSFIARFSPSGEHLWSYALGSATEIYWGRGLALLPDGTAVAAVPYYGVLDVGGAPLLASSLDVGVVAFTPQGSIAWARRFGGDGMDAPWDIAAAPDGDVVLGGTFEGTLDVGLCPATSREAHDAFLLKLDSAGTPRWIHAFGDSGPDQGDPGAPDWPSEIVSALGVAADGTTLMVGEWDGDVDWGTGPIWASAPGDLVVARFAR